MPLSIAAWHLFDSAQIDHGEVTVHGCCVAIGVARHWFTEIASAGRWRIAIFTPFAGLECCGTTRIRDIT